MEDNEGYAKILKEFITPLLGNVEIIAKRAMHVTLPVLTPEKVKSICSEAKILFSREPSMLELEPHVIIVGDIHGHLLDLIRIFETFGLPDRQKYLFLGDLVDRGEFSIECVIILFICKILYPENFHIIRGNHEFIQMCSRFGFSTQIADVYNNSEVFEAFNDTFSYMPLSALVGTQFFCVHGGLGPNHCFLQQFKDIQRPITTFSSDFVEAMLWSDPYTNVDFFEDNQLRGYGYLFGKDAVQEFITQNKLKLIIRAHECIAEGFSSMHDGTVLTVFSASNYCGYCENQSAVLIVSDNDTITPHYFHALSYLRRNEVIYNSPLKKAKRGVRKLVFVNSSKSLKTMPVNEPALPYSRGMTPRKRITRRKSFS